MPLPVSDRSSVGAVPRGSGVLLGLTLMVIGLALYRSPYAAVLGRWSRAYALLLGVAALGTVASGLLVMGRGAKAGGRRRWVDADLWLDLAVLSYGAGYLIGAVIDPSSASRALDLNLTGSIIAPAVVLEWVATGCLLVAGICLIPRLPPRARNFATSVAAVGVTVLLLEGAARALALVDPVIQGFPTNRTKIWNARYFKLNQAGFRDREHALLAAPGVRRLLIVGDSYASGEGLADPDDRFGQRLANALSSRTGSAWEPIFAAQPNTHTLHHIEFLGQALPLRPDLVILLYVFNDIDYLRQVTYRSALTEHPQGLADRLYPLRILLVNSFAFQELFARYRQLPFVLEAQERSDPYTDAASVNRHLQDLGTFVAAARKAGAAVVILPFDVSVAVSDHYRERYRRFVAQLAAAGLPVWPAAEVFEGHSFDSLTVGQLDRHPSAFANALLADAILPQALELVGTRTNTRSASP